MAVKYTLDFDTNTGSDITYELDILDDDFSGVATKLKGGAEPVSIEWKIDDDVYMPVMGSRASINILLEDGDVIDDLNDGGEFKYEVRLRYKDADDNLHDVWKGWIQPNDGQERIGSYPLEISYIAVDYLGIIRGPIREPEDRGEVLLLHYILDALEATGLGLDVRIDSAIQNEDGNDPLIEAMVDERAFVSSNPQETYPNNVDSKLEVLSGILAAFNCKVRQSNGVWYIFNNSTYEGTGDSETVTWKAFEYNTASSSKVDGTNYEAVTDVTENVLYTIDGDSTTGLHIANDSLYLIPRLPLGSVETRFQDLRPRNLVPNYNFDQDTSGWAVHTDSVDQSLSISANGGLDESKAITTNRTRAGSDNNSEIWFEIDSASAFQASRQFGHKLRFKWKADFNDSDVRTVRLPIQVYIEFESNLTQTKFTGSSNWFHWFQAVLGNSSNLTSDITSNRLYHNYTDSKWKLNEEGNSFWDWSSLRHKAETSSDGGWFEETIDLGKIGDRLTGVGGGANYPDEKPKMYVRFMYPEALDSDGDTINAATDQASVFVDDISITGDYSGDDLEVVFERYQDDYTHTLEYEPNIIGDDVLDQEFYEILDTTDYWESGQDVDNDESRSLEQIVTNQKLKDFQSQFYYYNAEIINNTAIPIGMQNKIFLDLDTESRSTTFILNGGTFLPKSNMLQVEMYEPNQTSEESFGTFARENVTLIGAQPPVRDNLVNYAMSFDIQATDDDDNVVTDGLVPADDKYAVIITRATPGDLVEATFDIQPADGYEIDGNVELIDNASYSLPLAIQDSSIERVGTVSRVTLSILIPDEDEYEELRIEGGVDELVGDNSRVIFSATDSMVNADLGQGTGQITELGPVGATEKFLYYVVADDTYEMKVDALTVTLDSVKDGDADTDTDVSGVITSSDIRKIQSGTGVIVEVPFKYSDTTPVYAKLSFSGTATTIPAQDTVTYQVTATEAGTDTSNWSISDSDITQTCVPGTPLTFIFELNPESGRTLPPGNVSLGSIEEAALGDYYVTGDNTQNTEALVFLTGTCPTANGTAAITINATTTAGTSGDDLNSYGITMTAPTNTTINGDSSPTLELQEGQTADIVVSLEANTGYNLGTIAVNTTNLPTGITYNGRTDFGDLDEVEISDFYFTITGQSGDDTGNVIAFTGSAADANKKYTLLLNINTDADSINADTDKKQIRVPFGLADTNEAISSQTFEIYSSTAGMEFNATGDVSFTVTEDGDHDGSFACTASSISDGVITATITGTLPNNTLPEDGIAEVDVTVTGAPDTLIDATTGSISSVTSDSVRANTGVTTFTVTSNGAWKLRSYGEESLIPLNEPLADFTPRSGEAGTFTITCRPKIQLGTNGRLVNSNGTDNNSGATSGTVNVYLVVDSQTGDYDTNNLDSDSFSWTALGSADDNIVSSLDINTITMLTQTEYDNLSDPDDKTFYLITS